MQPSVPLARVWVGGGVFNVGSSDGGHDYCGCHFLEEKGTLDDDPAFQGCLRACLLLACCAGQGPHREGENEGHEPVRPAAGSGRGTDIGSLYRHRRKERGEEGEDLLCPPTARLSRNQRTARYGWQVALTPFGWEAKGGTSRPCNVLTVRGAEKKNTACQDCQDR